MFDITLYRYPSYKTLQIDSIYTGILTKINAFIAKFFIHSFMSSLSIMVHMTVSSTL